MLAILEEAISDEEGDENELVEEGKDMEGKTEEKEGDEYELEEEERWKFEVGVKAWLLQGVDEGGGVRSMMFDSLSTFELRSELMEL